VAHGRRRLRGTRECANIIRDLLKDETVAHNGRVTLVDCKLHSLPEQTPMLLGGGGYGSVGRIPRQLSRWSPYGEQETGSGQERGRGVPALRRCR
jgi:alkanesulfonate monooxygenase SsuD/methylene tetrahydromethanopterin reductase-like flavin-dependent oxidoreductase (luciferase family)